MRLDRPDRQVERFGERLVLHAAQVMRGHEKAVIVRQCRERLVEPIPQLEIFKRRVFAAGIARWKISTSFQGNLARLATEPRLRAHVEDNAIDPCREPRVATKIRQPSVDLEEY